MQFAPRLLSARIVRLVEQFPVVVLSGARQVGKSTLLQHLFPAWDFITLDASQDVGNARADPDLFLDNHPPPLILDEIQHAPELVAALKRRVDRSRKTARYLLTGSQQWSVLRSVAESLAGRAVFLELEGFCLAELAPGARPRGARATTWLGRFLDDPRAFLRQPGPRLLHRRTLVEQLFRGFLPEANRLDLDLLADFQRSYLTTYIERDARLIADVADWQLFGRFAQLAAALTGQEINHSQLGRDLGVTPQTAGRWLATLRATFQWLEVPAFHGNAVKRVSGRPKGYLADTGLACSLQRLSSPQTLEAHPLAGPLFETAVAGEIRKLSGTLSTPPRLHHWRSHGGAEIDLLLERDGTFFPLEIKLSSRVGSADARGFAAFRETYPKLKIAPGLILAPVERAEKVTQHDWAVPWDLRG